MVIMAPMGVADVLSVRLFLDPNDVNARLIH